MLRAENLRTDKIMSVLEDLRKSRGELQAAEEYLNGQAGEEALAGITFVDMTKIPGEKAGEFDALFTSFFRRKHFEEAARLFNLLYAIGGSTCSVCFHYIFEFCNKVRGGEMAVDRAAALAVYTQGISQNSYLFDAHTLVENMAPLAQGDPGVVLQAYREYRGQYSNGKILLLTLYFFLRYGEDKLSGLTAGQEARTLLDQGDRELMEDYEELILSSLGMIMKPDASKEPAVQGILERIRQGGLSREELTGIRGRAVDEDILKLLGGCAYANYMLSERLRLGVMFCGAASPLQMLIAMEVMDLRGKLERLAGELEELFGISDKEVVSWAADWLQRGINRRTMMSADAVMKILRGQFAGHREAFLEGYREAEYQAAEVMAQIMKEADPELYRREVAAGKEAQRDKVIRLILGAGSPMDVCRDYLAGKAELSDLYGVRNQIKFGYRSIYDAGSALKQYVKTYGDEEFYARCMAYIALGENGYFFTSVLTKDEGSLEEGLAHIFRGLETAGLKLKDQLAVVCIMVDQVYMEERKRAITQGCLPIFLQYLAERTGEMQETFAQAGAFGRYFALLVYGSEAALQVTEENRERCEGALKELARGKDAWQEQILSYSQDSSKLVRKELERILAQRPSWRPKVEELLSSGKAASRELGIRVLAEWNTPRDREALGELYEREKNAKLKSLLEGILGRGGSEADCGEESGSGSLEELVKELHKGGKKRGLSWAYKTPFSPVHKRNGETASEEYLQALLLCYASLPKPGVSPEGARLAGELEPHELEVYVGELFDKWMEEGAEAKKRWVLYAASLHGGAGMVQRLHRQIQEWPQRSRGAIAADAVQALALSPEPQALLIVDGIARKFKFRQVKTAAGQALEFAAKQLGLSREQLEDRIVPDLGFDEHMERRFDYGGRSFTVTVTPALEAQVYDEKGKKLKNMPAPGAKDDGEKAAAAYGAFKEMKKQMKATVVSQKQRLELALSAERLWTKEAWQALFVQNPIMHQFAIGLIWGIYEEHKLVRSFRYMEDGSFNTEDEEEYSLPEQGQIGLVHPIELSGESLEAWRQQLADYEITQPIEQLDRTVYHLTEKERESKCLERFGGMLINDLSLGGKLTALGWYRGSVQDAGVFDTYYREDASLGLGAELHFSGSFVGSGSMGGEEVTVYDVRFYRAGSIERGSYCYDEADEEKRLPLRDIPPRYFSEVVWQLARATASSKERDEDWKETRR